MSLAAPSTKGQLLGRTYGVSMWPALRPGDLLFGHALEPTERPLVGSVLVAEGPRGLVAHRLVRITSRGASEQFLLAGDLSGPDFPLPRKAVHSVAVAIHRAGIGFIDVPGALAHGPIGRPVVNAILGTLLSIANRGSTAADSKNLVQLAVDVPPVQGILEK